MGFQITVRIPDDLEKDLSALGQKLRLKRSDIVRIALEKFIGEFMEGEGTKPYDRVSSIIGIISTGVPDLGEAHRKYLVKKIKRHA